MFIVEPFKPPYGSTASYEVRYPKGRKPFETYPEACSFARECRALEKGWAEIAQLIRIVMEKKQGAPAPIVTEDDEDA